MIFKFIIYQVIMNCCIDSNVIFISLIITIFIAFSQTYYFKLPIFSLFLSPCYIMLFLNIMSLFMKPEIIKNDF